MARRKTKIDKSELPNWLKVVDLLMTLVGGFILFLVIVYYAAQLIGLVALWFFGAVAWGIYGAAKN